MSDNLLWIPTYGHTSVSQPAKTYIHQLCVDIGYRIEDLLRAMADGDKWWERIKEICAISSP